MSPPDCRRCAAATIAIDAGEYAETVPAETTRLVLCTHCLALESAPTDGADTPTTAGADHEPAVAQVSEQFPTGEAAVPFALLVGLLENLALNRAAITDLLAAVEHAGVDPLARLEQLTHDPEIEPAIDLEGRARQLEQLL
ncbi:MAG: hypothetical protein J07HX5_01217 [halophilic archaeon J07HX5]|jgi:hypothetical protein|nr:MAG: hypothetical protein J07HX5_01217 [halophilic archaeon J07HX5]